MKNVPLLKSNITNSPKTAGGISKSLLTPCRRVGLSRNWKNKGPSPFISPLTGSPDVKEDKTGTRKRKERVNDEVDNIPVITNVDKIVTHDDKQFGIDKTPSRNIELPRRKKSKTLLSAINKSQEDLSTDSVATDDTIKENLVEASEPIVHIDITKNTENVSTPVRTQSKKVTNRSPALKSRLNNSKHKQDKCIEAIVDTTDHNPKGSPETIYEIKERSPNDLKRECIVVIQRKIFNKTNNSIDNSNIIEHENKKEKPSLPALSDSDSDEVPLIQLNSKGSTKSKQETSKQHELIPNIPEITDLNEDDDFIGKSTKIQVKKVKEEKSPKLKLKCNKNKSKVEKIKVVPKPSSQSSHDDDDDDDFDNKKTILIRKTYVKVSKPMKAKSTGTITQKDIDELTARIEAKKKLLLAKSISPDTEELRNLIKKWQKGCQDALIELLDLMKTKCHDKEDMDYSEMLKTLKIPPSLVGYDSENDCFNSPDDASIILGQFNDI